MSYSLGEVYLLQPGEFINTNIYKVGHSKKNTMQRPKSYGSGTQVYDIYACANPKKLEQELVDIFNQKFELHKGREYFSGNLTEMRKIFINCIYKYKDLDIDPGFVNGFPISADEFDEIQVKKITKKEKNKTHYYTYNGKYEICDSCISCGITGLAGGIPCNYCSRGDDMWDKWDKDARAEERRTLQRQFDFMDKDNPSTELLKGQWLGNITQ